MKKVYLLSIMAALLLTGCPEQETIKPKTYTIQFNNYDGKNLQTSEVEENVMPVYQGETPSRTTNDNYSYTFKGWEPEIVPATKDATYVATYDATFVGNKYVIKFVNYDGTELQSSEVIEGETPTYNGTTPSKPAEGDIKYRFIGWSPEIVAATTAATYTATFESYVEYGTKTIAEVKELCKTVTDLNPAGIGIDMARKVTIKGVAIAKTNLVKTTKKFNLDVSEPAKVFLGDDTGLIACATKITNDGHSLWGKVADYVGQPTSKYEVTGYLSMYLNQPELYVPADSYTWDQDLAVEFDVNAATKGVLTLTEFYDKAVATTYNCAGHGYNEVHTIKGLRVVDKRDKVFVCTDGEKMIKLFGNKQTLIVGKTYDVIGYITLNNWVPSLSVLSAEISAKETPEISKTAAISTTMTQLRANKSSQDDTNVKQDSFIRSFANLYKANVYASCYVEGGNFYVTVSDKYDASENYVTGDEIAVSSAYQMVAISNDNYWNINENEMNNYCPIRYWLFEETTFEFYFVPFLQEFRTYNKVSNPLWKVFAINSLLPEPPEVI